MKNEDDTFRILKRKTYDEVMSLLVYSLVNDNFTIDINEKCNEELLKYGWTLQEFNNEFEKRK